MDIIGTIILPFAWSYGPVNAQQNQMPVGRQMTEMRGFNKRRQWWIGAITLTVHDDPSSVLPELSIF